MDLNVEMVDHALATTRSVRKRLDFDRDVSDELILDCIDVAEQAPTGGNQGSRRWIIVRDQATKDSLAELYLKAGGSWVIETAARLKDTDHHSATMMQGAAYLAENIARVPALVIPTIIGRHDNSGRPGLFDSVIQSGWSFHVALRARGLGSTWTTMYMNEAPAVAELLHIPDDVTQIALFPVAYTKGTDFKRAKRYPAREISYFDRYGRTLAEDRSEPRALADGPGILVEVDIKAKPDVVWGLVTDLNNHAQWSGELQRAEWTDNGDEDGEVDGEPGVGATFQGHNKRDDMGEWTVTCHVLEWEENRRFSWCVENPDNHAARWTFVVEPVPGGSRLRYHARLGPGPSGLSMAIERMGTELEPVIIASRQNELRDNMAATINGIKGLAEATGDE